MSTFNRQPLKPNCFPQPPQVPQSIGQHQQCSALPALRAAMYAVMTGNGNKLTRDQDRWVERHAPNVKELKAEIRRLEIICEQPHRRALRAGPYIPPGAVPPYAPGYGFPFGYGWPW